MKAVIYARYSSDNQREESIEGQIRECMEYANHYPVLQRTRPFCRLLRPKGTEGGFRYGKLQMGLEQSNGSQSRRSR